MEKTCEFCAALRPVVYCKADAAHLCLSCDAKVHSANSLSNRHLRTILCDSCRNQPANIQCLDHLMILCRVCDKNLHDVSSQHQKRAIRSYMGCPSAKVFAALWGFELGEPDSSTHQDELLSPSCGSGNSSVANLDTAGQSCSQVGGLSKALRANSSSMVSVSQSKLGSSSQHCKVGKIW